MNAFLELIMKTTTSLLTLASGIALPALAAAYIAHGAYFTEILLGSYAITGLLAIAANDCSTQRLFAYPKTTRRGAKNWVRLSLIRSAHPFRTLRAEKSAA